MTMKTNSKLAAPKKEEPIASLPPCPICAHPMRLFLTVLQHGREPELEAFHCLHCTEVTALTLH
jgi:hypothetical protein